MILMEKSKKYIIKLPWPGGKYLIDSKYAQEDMLNQMNVFPIYIRFYNNYFYWIIQCTREQLSFLVLKGAKIVPND